MTTLNKAFIATFILLTILLTSCTTTVQPRENTLNKQTQINEKHYRIYRADGTPASLTELIAASKAATVTFVGEFHDDPVAHYLEAQILRKTWDKNLSLSLEMFETDVQYVLDEYLAGMISESHLIKSGRAWKKYKTDYKPMIEFAKENNIPVIAANAPRRYVNMVGRTGAESLNNLSTQAKQFLPPLPYKVASPAYTKKFNDLMAKYSQGAMSGKTTAKKDTKKTKPTRDPDWQLQAQSLWDASMAYSIAQTLGTSSMRVLHINGSFHSAEHMGILDHLKTYRPNTSTLVITIMAEDNFPEFNAEEMRNQGDFIIVTDASLPRSWRRLTTLWAL